MGPYGFPRIPTGAHESQWVHTGPHEYPSVPAGTHLPLRVPTGPHGSALVPMGPHGSGELGPPDFFARAPPVRARAKNSGPSISPWAPTPQRGMFGNSTAPPYPICPNLVWYTVAATIKISKRTLYEPHHVITQKLSTKKDGGF